MKQIMQTTMCFVVVTFVLSTTQAIAQQKAPAFWKQFEETQKR